MFNQFLTVVSDLALQFSSFVSSLPFAPGMELGDTLVNLGFNLIYASAVCSVLLLPFIVVAFIIRSVAGGLK